MSMFKRIMSVLMALLLLVGLFPQVPLQIRASETLVSTEGTESTETETTEATEPAESVPEEPATMITRVQWIQALVESFEYTLSADAMPDNYFADITGEEEYYDAIMTAVYHGLVDSLPGTEFRPDDPATREFAAQTLNSCMGYLPSEETYSYSEYETVTYPDDIQVAVEEGWFALVDGAFLPEQAITSAEVENLVAVAREFVNGMIIEEGHENQYTFKEGVIEITDAAEIEVSEDRTTAMISIQDCTATVVSGDTFVVYTNGLAAPYQALEVAQIDGTTVISAICLQFGDAIETMDVQMSMDTDPTNYYTAEDAELVFIEETTGEEYASAEAALFAMRTNEFAVVIPKFTKTLDLGGGMTVSISVELKSAKICVDSNIGWSKKSCSVWLDTNADITAKVSCDLGEMVDSPIEVYVGGYNVSGVGGLSFYLKVDITGAVTVVQKYHLKCGITLGYNSDKDKPIKKMIFKVREKGSSINAEVTAKLYLEAKFGLYGEVLPVRGYLYGEIGFKATLRYTTYEGIEGDCTHFAAYLYAEYGAKVEWGYGPWSNELDWNREPINEDNSPIKIGAHYEDGVEVAACTRTGMSGTSVGESSKIADSGYVTTQESSYSGSGMLSGSSSTGHTSSGEPVTVYSYTLDDDDNATITGYYGNVSSLTIPMTLDGYDVVAIGNNAFNGHTELRTVIIQDNITSIGTSAFEGCSNLRTVTLSDSLTQIAEKTFQYCSKLTTIDIPDLVISVGNYAFAYCTNLQNVNLSSNLQTLGNSAFAGCTKLASIWIPKTLTSAGYENWGYTYSGAFNGCSALKTVTFEEGITEIPKFLFVYCSGVESITIPDSVTVIEERAFCWAQNLKEVNFGSGLVEIQSGAFADCTGLETITLPDVLVTIGTLAFNNCTNLATVEFSDSINTIGDKAFENCTSLTSLVLPKQLTTMGNSAFGNCTSITEVWIPKTLTSAGYENWGYTYSGAFNSCSALKTVTFEEGITEIPKFLFVYCSGLESITIPDSVTVIEERAFSYAQNLKEVNFGNGLVEIQKGAFANCAALETMVISDSVTTMGERVFECSTALRSVTWSAGMKSVPGYTFDQCTALAEVVLTESVTTIGDNAFSNCDSLIELTLPDSVTTMGKYVFNDCDALTGIHLSESLTSISQYAFYDCDALENVTMASKLTTMGDYAFYHCDALKNVKLSLRLTSIPSYAFYGCGSLEEIVIPYYTISISGNAFNSCPKLAKVATHGNLASIESSAFSYPNLTVFYGTAGSYTQTWAEENGYTFNENTSAATAVALGENQITLAKGATYTLALNIDPTDFSEAITFKSNKTSVVTVDERGVLTAVGVGTATIKIIVGDASASCKVTVTQAVTKIELDKTILSLDVPETYQLTATITPTDASNQVLAWTSSDDSVATVDEKGLVTAVGNGTVTITATATDGSGISASCTVTVTDPNNIPVSSIALNQTDATMQALEIIQLIATVGPENAANKTLSWSSSDESVAIVDQNGVVTAIAKGTAVITATATDDSGVSASCTVVVTNTAYIVDNIEDLQSSHNYENNCKDFWVYTVNGAVSLDVTFDEQTEIEDGFDYLHIYDGEGNLIGTYTGTELAGQTVNVSGSTIRIMIETDDSGTEWGFKVVSVEPTFENREYEILEGANSTWTDNGTEEVAVRVDSEIEDFIEVRLNGELVAPENYTVIEGSTIVTFKPEFLATLKPGEYALSIVFVDGQADTTLTIVEEHVHEFVDGVCTGCGKEVSTGTINKRSAILELENMVRIVLKMTSYTGFEGIDLTENMGLLVWSEDAELTDETATFENAEQVVEGGFLLDGVYCVKTEGIAAKELGDDLQMRIYVRLEDGSYVYDKLVSYSALKYARSTIQKSSNEELVALCKAMLNYGAAAQIAFNYKTESLMNAELSEEDKVLNWDASILDAVEAVDANKVVGLDRNKTVFTNRGAVLALEGAVNIQFRMGIAGAYAETAQEIGILYWSADTYQAVDVLTAENADLTDTMVYSESVGRYVSEYPGIAPKDLGDTVYACAYLVAEDGTYYHSGVVAYSVEKYIENTIKDSSTAAEETKTLVKWLGIYGELAKEYFY